MGLGVYYQIIYQLANNMPSLLAYHVPNNCRSSAEILRPLLSPYFLTCAASKFRIWRNDAIPIFIALSLPYPPFVDIKGPPATSS